ELSALCLPTEAGEALSTLLRGAPLGTTFEVVCQASSPQLLGLPFELLQLPDGSRIALQPNVDFWRTPGEGVRSTGASSPATLPHPLKVLVAVGAPYEENTDSSLLDYEQELQNILDAVEAAERDSRSEVRFLEVGGPQFIQDSLSKDDYHVLHLSCHGNAGVLELENEAGDAVPTSPEKLVEHLRKANKRIPLVFLNACHTAVGSDQTAGFALTLLRAGVPAVVAMQAAVSDEYATKLATAFYANLSEQELAYPSRALSAARRTVEQSRRDAEAKGAAPAWPEHATATLYLAGEDQPLVVYGGKAQPLKRPPVHTPEGVVPGLKVGDLIGRRKPLRSVLKSLRSQAGEPGIVLRGIGGLGKSALAGRVMQRCREDGWRVAAFAGPLSLNGICAAVAEALREPVEKKRRKPDDPVEKWFDPEALALADKLVNSNARDEQRVNWIAETLRTERLLLVFDDFERNLETGGQRFLSPETGSLLSAWVNSPPERECRLLVTCRYPLHDVPELKKVRECLLDVALEPLIPAEMGKLYQRLPALRTLPNEERAKLGRTVGGHPRMLEFVNALLTPRKGEVDEEAKGRRRRVWQQMEELAGPAGVALEVAGGLSREEAT
ncbi:MAG: CHAT domain-containing protein, partial [Planctomycetaceae bacterium]